MDRHGFVDGPPSKAQFHNPMGVWYHTGAKDVIYVADCNNHAIRAVDPTTGYTTTLAGSGAAGRKNDPDSLKATFRWMIVLISY